MIELFVSILVSLQRCYHHHCTVSNFHGSKGVASERQRQETIKFDSSTFLHLQTLLNNNGIIFLTSWWTWAEILPLYYITTPIKFSRYKIKQLDSDILWSCRGHFLGFKICLKQNHVVDLGRIGFICLWHGDAFVFEGCCGLDCAFGCLVNSYQLGQQCRVEVFSRCGYIPF